MFPPAHPPDPPPIEEAFSELSALVRTAAARTWAGLDQAIAAALRAITAADAASWFSQVGSTHRGAA